jgi:Cof subfamily protein (haloacid dehalogenase superfamily)
MKRKILFFDIDGTILSHRTFSISDSTRKAIKNAQLNGHIVFINTGRSMAEIGNDVRQIGFDGFICGCGTYIIYHYKVLLHRAVPTPMALRLIEDFRKYQIEAVLEGTDKSYFDKDDSVQSPIIKAIKRYHTFYGKDDVGSWDDENISFDKFCMSSHSKEALHRFRGIYKDSFDFMNRMEDFDEVVPKGYSKATGIEFILKYLNMEEEDTYAFGDSVNDLPMLSYVRYSIAMGNSSPGILDKASYVTKDVDEEGIACALRHYHII